MATVIEGQSSSVGQIVKKVTSDSTSVTGPEFELFHKKEVTAKIAMSWKH